ncbi:hypothetical protein GCM10010922_20720 [Microbacterium sorbitolivorans]|nr:hypothetical protein GCM10010922_20720 [Microbacterium sorbitolivorans]
MQCPDDPGRIHSGCLPARTGKVPGRDGRLILKALIRVSDLDALFRVTAREEHVQRIGESAPPLTDDQKRVIYDVFLKHRLEREANRERIAAGPA